MTTHRTTLLAAALCLGMLPRVAAADPKEDHWHKVAEDFVANFSSDQDPVKARHDRIAKFCGHDIKFVFDWKTFKIADWVGKNMGGGYVADETTAAKNCVADLLDELARACENDPARRAKIARVKTVTCFWKELPYNHGYSHAWKLSKGGTNIDNPIVPALMDAIPDADTFIKQSF